MIDPSIDARLVRDIDAGESDKLEAYLDSLGNWTIGRGHLLPKAAPGQSWKGFTIAQFVSDRYFNEDVASAIRYATALPEFAQCDTDCRCNALVELCFNMRGRWDGFHRARAAIEAKNWKVAHDELLDSEWAAEVQPHHFVGAVCSHCGTPRMEADKKSYCKALVNGRAVRLANYLLTGEYP